MLCLQWRIAAFAGALFLVTACASSRDGASVSPPSSQTLAHSRSGDAQRQVTVREVCPDTGDPTLAFCQSLLRTDVHPSSPYGYEPADLQSAYNLPVATNGTGQTVAVVVPYSDPDVEADLFIYRNTFGMPVCSTLNGCFVRVNQKGQKHSYPPPDQNWGIEMALNLDMISATCPNCNLLLVQAERNTWKDLGIAVDTAARLGANVIAITYGGAGNPNPADYNHPGTVIVAAASDHGYGGHKRNVPSDFPTVVSIGGTHLEQGGGSRGWTETVWESTGAGCSRFAKPAWQTDHGCKGRTANDASADADPATGVAIYDTYQESGWQQIGGNSVSTAINAGVFGLAGNASQLNAAQSLWTPGNQQYLNDITSGLDGSCKPAYLCTAGKGYDGPSGWGTPNGIGAY